MVLVFRLIFNSLWLALHCVLVSKGESYKSIASLTELAANKDLISGIREFQRRRINELEKLQRTIDFLQHDHDTAYGDLLDYLGNPINAYKLIKRMVIEWKEIHGYVRNSKATLDFGEAWKSYTEYVDLPNELDLEDAIEGLTSVRVYADGAGGDIIYGSNMTWDECYEVGIRLYDKQDYIGAVSWLQQALHNMDNTEENSDVKLDILEYIGYSRYMLGDIRNAVLALEQALAIPIADSTIAESLSYFLLKRNTFVTKTVLLEPHVIHLKE